MNCLVTLFPRREDPGLHGQLVTSCRQAAETVADWFAFAVDELEVEVYTSRELWIEQHTRLNEDELASWVAGDCGRIIRVVASGSDHHLLQMVGHECVHHIIRVHAGSIPAWLDEGLAMYLLLGMPKRYAQTLKKAVAHGAFIPFDLLEKPFSLLDRRLKDLAYAQGCAMVRHLEISYGRSRLRSLLTALGRGDNLAQALRPLGLNMYLLEKELVRHLQQEHCGKAKT